jgi:hypothetical protein
MELTGKVILVGATETKGAKEFKIRQIVIETDEQYPQSIPVQFVQDKCFILDNYAVGDLVKIGINIKGAEWQGRYFANIQGWQISKVSSTGLTSEQQMPDREPVYGSVPKMNGDMANQFNESQDAEDDLPF